MAHTDKTDPFWVRLGISREDYENKYFARAPRSFKWRYDERGVGPKEARASKRMRSKKNRRRDVPHTAMRGYGWGEENLRYR